MTERKTPYAKFFSAVEGHVVSRYGTAGPTQGPEPIGYRRKVIDHGDPDKPVRIGDRGAGELIFEPDVIVAISEPEWARFNREYSRALRNEALRERTEDEYLAYLASQDAPPAPPPGGNPPTGDPPPPPPGDPPGDEDVTKDEKPKRLTGGSRR